MIEQLLLDIEDMSAAGSQAHNVTKCVRESGIFTMMDYADIKCIADDLDKYPCDFYGLIVEAIDKRISDSAYRRIAALTDMMRVAQAFRVPNNGQKMVILAELIMELYPLIPSRLPPRSPEASPASTVPVSPRY